MAFLGMMARSNCFGAPMILRLITWFYAVSAILVAHFLGAPWTEILALALFSALICAQLLIFYALGQIYIAMSTAGTARPLRLLQAVDARFSICNKDGSLFRGLQAMTILYPLFFAFTAFKSLIPLIHPYDLDPFLAQLDFDIHGGQYPHRFLGSLNQSPVVVRCAEYIYYAWFLIVLVANGFAAFFDTNQTRRTCYLWGSVLSWMIVGSVGATLLSSVGPIFYGDFYSAPNPYSDIQANFILAQQNGAVLWPEAVNVLLDIYKNNIICDLNGISAMPSMHVGISFLITLYAFTIHRKAGIIALIFTVLIFLSSILMGFHYAIDGYVSCGFIAAIWTVIRFIQRQSGRPVYVQPA